MSTYRSNTFHNKILCSGRSLANDGFRHLGFGNRGAIVLAAAGSVGKKMKVKVV